MRAKQFSNAVTIIIICLALVLCGLVAWIVYQPTNLQSQPEPGLERYALVMVAAHYRSLPSRPDYIRHARAMAHHAEEAGYALIGGGVVINPTEYEIRQGMDILGRLTEGGAEALIYFAGHAIPGDNTIYLLATDINPMPLVRYDVGGVRLEAAWSHPLGAGPSKTTIIIETRGMGGLFSGRLPSIGTGFDTLDVPDTVTVAISGRDGPVIFSRDALHRSGSARPPLLPFLWNPHTTQTVLFTPALIELGILQEPDLAAGLALVSLEVHERSSSQISPVIFARRSADIVPPVRSEPPSIQIAQIEEHDDAIHTDDVYPDAASAPVDAAVSVEAAVFSPPPSPDRSRTGQSVIELIRMFEAFRARTYLDEAGILTIGYGHTGPDARAGNVISYERAMELLMEDIDTAATAVDAAVTRELTDNQRNALISLTFNIGAEAFRNSTLVRQINSDIHSVSAAQFLRWVHARVPGVGMSALRGLESRRQLEAFLFLIQDEGVDALGLILSFEPFRQNATRVNNCSMIGYGRALPPCEQEFDLQISQVEALQLLKREAGMIESEVRALVGVPVSDAQIAALISFVHQNGTDMLARSRILSRLNQGDYNGAANALRLHNAFAGGPAMQVGASHIERRAAEAALFFAHGGDYFVMPQEAAT
ncbi:MAG: lysozyme [Oceanicaulis sp.]|nr:lysozyme [Oceanicaulis sp.]